MSEAHGTLVRTARAFFLEAARKPMEYLEIGYHSQISDLDLPVSMSDDGTDYDASINMFYNYWTKGTLTALAWKNGRDVDDFMIEMHDARAATPPAPDDDFPKRLFDTLMHAINMPEMH